MLTFLPSTKTGAAASAGFAQVHILHAFFIHAYASAIMMCAFCSHTTVLLGRYYRCCRGEEVQFGAVNQIAGETGKALLSPPQIFRKCALLLVEKSIYVRVPSRLAVGFIRRTEGLLREKIEMTVCHRDRIAEQETEARERERESSSCLQRQRQKVKEKDSSAALSSLLVVRRRKKVGSWDY